MKKAVVLVLLFAIIGSALAAPINGNEKSPAKNGEISEFYAGREVKAIVSEDGYSLIDLKTGDTILLVNFTAIEENLSGKPAITKEEAVKLATQLCGPAYTLVRATENPYDFDILFERRVNGISVFGENCYVSVNKMTGKIAAYRKMPVREITFKPEVKISRDEVIKMTGAVDAKLILIPLKGTFWVTSKPNSTIINAVTGKELSKKEIEALKELYKTTVDFNELGKMSVEKDPGIMATDNNQGAVFRDDDDITKDDIMAAKESMEKQRPYGELAWDPYVSDYDVVGSESTVNFILEYFEGVYFSGHGNNDCIGIGGDNQYCYWEASGNLQTRVFVVSACYAGNNFATYLNNKGVQCVIGASNTISDGGIWWSECANWADIFWDKATGNIDAGYQRSAHTARIETNTDTWLNWCDLDVEKGNCNTYI
ncbi:hypothetical protein [Geoglobus acetivorans]|uniref:C13 family peptidase n=1 Tax=Geoglobus acetivorans TaxID=565033 RepID=A0ABZ3H4Q8_GEOAI|nr:hypothetical protein [Geoglobus acetivorans]